MIMAEGIKHHILPDAPFRSGAPGKYKLLVKSVEKKGRLYEYVLSDAEQKEYKATSTIQYSENQLLRCVISFVVKGAKLLVTDTVICKNQDLLPPTANVGHLPTRQEASLPEKGVINGNPSLVNTSGSYQLTVDYCKPWIGDTTSKNLYVLYDNSGQQYYAISKENYTVGEKVVCRVEVLKERAKHVYFVAFSNDSSSIPVGEVDGDVILRHHYLSSAKPTKTPHAKNKSQKRTDSLKKKPIEIIAFNKYKKGERYNFIATSERDSLGYQIMKDEAGRRHLLVSTSTRYEEGDKVRCTVRGVGKKPIGTITGHYLVLSEPRLVRTETISVSYSMIDKNLIRGFSDVQGLGRHKCGKPFVCNCCGKSFPANAGWRVDLRDIYFCNSCAKKVYDSPGRGNRHFIISTPMGNKR